MSDRSREPPQAQPWHPADEKKKHEPGDKKPSGVPIGTHSLTGGGASVGLPSSSPQGKGEKKAERGEEEREAPPGAEEPDPLLEPRAGGGDLLGRR